MPTLRLRFCRQLGAKPSIIKLKTRAIKNIPLGSFFLFAHIQLYDWVFFLMLSPKPNHKVGPRHTFQLYDFIFLVVSCTSSPVLHDTGGGCYFDFPRQPSKKGAERSTPRTVSQLAGVGLAGGLAGDWQGAGRGLAGGWQRIGRELAGTGRGLAGDARMRGRVSGAKTNPK